MKITLPLVSPAFDDKRITEEVKKDFDKSCEVCIYSSESDWINHGDSHVFSAWVEYGTDGENVLMFEVDLDSLELFASTILKRVEMLRRDYADVLKEKIKDGSLL